MPDALWATAAVVVCHGPMTDFLMSNDALDRLRSASKRVRYPGARWLAKRGRYKQRNFKAETADGSTYRIYKRQNPGDDQDFSCGLALARRGEKPLSLVRYNGESHVHGKIRYARHIHRATPEVLAAGTKVDSYAERADRYRTLEGALARLIEDCGVQGHSANHDEPDLFNGA